MCFDTDSAPPIPVISGAAVSHDDLVLEAADGNRFAAFSATPDEPGDDGHRDPPGRSRPLPLLRGARAALRRARLSGGRLRLLRADGRRREARRRLRLHAARAADDAGGHSGGRRRSRRLSPRDTAARRSSPSASASGGRQSWFAAASGHGLAGAVGFYGHAGRAQRRPGADPARRRDRSADPRPAGGRRREHHRPRTTPRSTRRSRRPASSTRSSPTTARRTASSTASRNSSRRIRRCVAEGARVRRALSADRARRPQPCAAVHSAAKSVSVDLPVEDRDVVLDAEPQDILALDPVLGRDLLGCEVVRHGTRSVRPSCAVWEPGSWASGRSAGAVVVDGLAAAHRVQRSSRPPRAPCPPPRRRARISTVRPRPGTGTSSKLSLHSRGAGRRSSAG